MGKVWSSHASYLIHHHIKRGLSSRIRMIKDSTFLISVVNFYFILFYFVCVIFVMFQSNNIVVCDCC